MDSTTAADIARAATGHDPGPMRVVESASHEVYVGAEVVVKMIDVGDHSRLGREVALVPHLPIGLTARLVDSGEGRWGSRDVRFACFSRVAGASPGMGLPGVDEAAAVVWAEDAVRQLRRLHGWVPAGGAAEVLSRVLDHGGFVGREALLDQAAEVRQLDRDGLVPRRLLDGVAALVNGAPEHAGTEVPVHADCHWGNWLVQDGGATVLLDFEWARFGEPMDDWFFLARFSGPHLDAVLDVIADRTGTPLDELRAGCELREVAHLVADTCLALAGDASMVAGNVRDLEDVVVGRLWWRGRP